jgi:hypothetical protein
MNDDFIILLIGGKWTAVENSISFLEENGPAAPLPRTNWNVKSPKPKHELN